MLFLVHVTGNSPHHIDLWRGFYQTPAMAKAQATRMTTNVLGEPQGDFVARLYRLRYHGLEHPVIEEID
jgi:hypothetical protein